MTYRISAHHLQGIPETLLPVLYARKVETDRPDAIIKDPVAVEWVGQIEYNFAQFDNSELTNLGVAVRTEIIDEYTLKFLHEHPDATVINIAAGLDTRYFRMKNDQLHWYELDLPEAILLRKALMEETQDHQCITSSALDFAWLDKFPRQHPTLVIVEGLLMYFTEEQVKLLLVSIADHFDQAQLLIEVMGISQSKRTHLNDAIAKTSAEFKWGIREVAIIAEWHPSLEYISDTSIYDRHESRWLRTSTNWKNQPAFYRQSVNRIVCLNISH